jgi:hypothetical protein
MNPELFSPHLFWDADIKKLDVKKHKQYIIQRVLEYGLLPDWFNMLSIYSLKEIAKVCVQIKSLEKRSASFIAFLANIPKKNFKCYSSRQLTEKHWNF